jgi:hypothetical protein
MATAAKADIWDNPWYMGLNTSYFVANNDYASTWNIVTNEGAAEWSGDIKLQFGFAGSIEVGKSVFEREINMGVILLYNDASNGLRGGNMLDTSMAVALLNFEYIFRHEEDINIYLGVRLGGAYSMTSGNLLFVSAEQDATRSIYGSFENLNQGLFAYTVRFGIYLTANMPLMLRVGYQFFGATPLQLSGPISTQTHTRIDYNSSPTMGNATVYRSESNAPLKFDNAEFQYSALEIGVQFLFDS